MARQVKKTVSYGLMHLTVAVSSITLFLVASFGIIGSVILTALDGIFLAFGCIVCVVVYMDLRKAT